MADEDLSIGSAPVTSDVPDRGDRSRADGPPSGEIPLQDGGDAAAGFAHDLESYSVSASAAVRPYFYTRGRTRAVVELPVEALVSVAPDASAPTGPVAAAFDLCREVRSVAEVAALMAVPLGVARVLLADLVAAGVAVVHRTADADGPDLALMQRVLSGLRNL